jgi:hypothetical protein
MLSIGININLTDDFRNQFSDVAEFLENACTNSENQVFENQLGVEFFRKMFPFIPADWQPFKDTN